VRHFAINAASFSISTLVFAEMADV